MKHLGKRLCSLLCLFALLCFPARAVSPNGKQEVEFYNYELSRYESATTAVVGLTLNGTILDSDVPAVLRENRTMIPVRLVSERLGAKVTWLDETNQVIVQNDQSTIVLTLGSATATVNGEEITLPDGVPAALMRCGSEERTMVPLRFVSEQLGCTVGWSTESYTASIFSASTVQGIYASEQTVLIQADTTPEYRIEDLGDRVVVDLLGARLGSGLTGAIQVDGDMLSSVRYAQHDSSLHPDYPYTVRVVLDINEGVCFQENVSIQPMDRALILSLFPVGYTELGYDFTAPKNPGQKTVVIDPGHGGNADGARYDGVPEKAINLSVAKKLEQILAGYGYHVIMTRSDDASVDLYTRAEIANKAGADLFVSLHSNASPTHRQFEGIYTYYYPGSASGQTLAKRIQSPITQLTGAIDRGTESAKFVVLRETEMVAVLVEMGFMSARPELLRLVNEGYQYKLAAGVAEGIVQYLNAH